MTFQFGKDEKPVHEEYILVSKNEFVDFVCELHIFLTCFVATLNGLGFQNTVPTCSVIIFKIDDCVLHC